MFCKYYAVLLLLLPVVCIPLVLTLTPYCFGRDIVLANPDECSTPRIRNYNELY